MIRTVLASTALFAAHAYAVGQAIVVNQCDYTVHMANTPAGGNGETAVNKALAPGGGSYSQTWTELNTGGWSIKLAKDDTDWTTNILQYEYTYLPGQPIWFDLSAVNGNPWDSDYEITAQGDGCTPRQAAYRFATDDAYGMQACNAGASITVTLCTGISAGKGGHKGGKKSGPKPSPPESSPAPAPTSESPAPTSAAPVPSTTAAPSPSSPPSSPHGGFPHHSWEVEGNKVEAPAGDAVGNKKGGKKTPTTLATESAAPTDNWDGPAVTVTNLAMETVTQFVTATAAPTKRSVHQHHARHPHHRR